MEHHPLDLNFLGHLEQQTFPKTNSNTCFVDTKLTPEAIIDLFETQIMSRQGDLMARKLRQQNLSFYTIGSSGHEGNAGIAKVFKVDDMAFLHYRDAAFYLQRAKAQPGSTPLYDLMLSFVAAKTDPISSGRHKVLGSKPLFIPPQTSTIASHLPKAVGAAYSIPRSQQMGLKSRLPHDSVILCSFGDASLNHSTSQGAINLASWLAYQQVPLPLVFVCEDNGLGISVPTPEGWVNAQLKNKPSIKYIYADGLNINDVIVKAKEAEHWARHHQKPVFLHLKTIRLMGHAGSDSEQTYLDDKTIQANIDNDPLLHTARTLLEEDILTADEIKKLYLDSQARIHEIAKTTAGTEKLKTAQDVMADLVPSSNDSALLIKPSDPPPMTKRFSMLEQKQLAERQHMAKLINWTLVDALHDYPNAVIFGEDVAKKGGVYNVTTGLLKKFGPARVFNSLLDEQSILGTAIGMAHNGFLPIPEIQFLAYLHNAEDQIRGEAATLSFFSSGQYTNPIVVRIAGLAYQKGFGGHFHNDNSVAVLRDIPGVIIACPSNGLDAALMLRRCLYEANHNGRVCVFLEPIALYMTKDLHQPKDGLWNFSYPAHGEMAELGQLNVHGNDLKNVIVTYGNGFYLSRQAGYILENQHKIKTKIIDLRWIAPLDQENLIEHLLTAHNILIVDECRKTGSISEAISSLIIEKVLPHVPHNPKIKIIAAEDSFIPLAEAANLVLPQTQDIVETLLTMQGEA